MLKDDDELLFLELLNSTLDHLLIFFIGQDQYSNSEKLPSPLVQKMMEKIETFQISTHKLHGFHPFYFQNRKSFSGKRKRLAEQLAISKRNQAAFFNQKALNDDKDQTKNIVVIDLINFFTNPSNYILSNRLGILSSFEEATPNDREMFRKEGLSGYLLNQEILQGILSGVDETSLKKYISSLGLLPEGIPSENIFEEAYKAIQELFDGEQALKDDEPITVSVNTQVGPYHVHGTIDQLFYSSQNSAKSRKSEG